MSRHDGRTPQEAREVQIQRRYLRTCPGSVLYRCGGTSVLVTAQITEEVPPFLEGKGTGWLTAEYAMLPGSTPTRKKRGPDGRSTEIQRLIGRSLRAVIDFHLLGPFTIHVDADVLEADGGTRTAAITAAYVAVVDALDARFRDAALGVVKAQVAAISAGIIHGVPMLDLDYSEDSHADVDLNVVRLGPDGYVEVQGTGEGGVFRRPELTAMLDLAGKGIDKLMEIQRDVLSGGD
ncbi:MAG: ribonuclease [Planctomycetota bacterium]|nr:ribonuclease [Planctomycetota bacterium]